MKNPKILIVEDDPLLIRMYQTKFNLEGFEVFIASDGEEGLSIIKENTPDFVILDMMMPKLSGMDLLELMHGDPVMSKVNVIMLSNMNKQEEMDKAKSLGVKEFLLKANFTPSEIAAKVKEYLG